MAGKATVIIFPDASQAKTVMGVATDPIFESCSSTVRSVPLTIGAADELTALESTSAGVEGRILVLARRGRALVELDLTFPSGREGDRDALIAQALTTADAATS